MDSVHGTSARLLYDDERAADQILSELTILSLELGRGEARRQSQAADIRQALRAEVRKFDADRARLEGRIAFYDAAERAVIATGIGTVAGAATFGVGAFAFPAAAAGHSAWGLAGLSAAAGVAGSGATQAYEIAAGDRDGYSLAEMGISGGVGGLLGPGVRAAGHAVRACGTIKNVGARSANNTARPFAERLADYERNPGVWSLESMHAETAVSRRAAGGVSEQMIYRNSQSGETIVRHRLTRPSGKDLEDHFRPMYKPRGGEVE
ncbi:MAG: hypothetical protein HRU70_10705 [Phycisphaeraceae bacterium]|nr:MAG: hypothetical protein HRU70_10705 [Phycisphaeraceae bacterium]